MTVPSGLLPPRPPEMQKGDAGRVFIVAGSEGLTGAAALCSLGAARVGAGLVTLGIPKSLNGIMEVKLTEVMTKPLPETKARTVSVHALAELVRAIESSDAAAIGPGLSRQPETVQLVRQLILKITKPCVLDADGLNALAEEPHQVLKKRVNPMVVTPHPGEMARLTTLSVEQVQSDRERIAKEFAARYGVVTVLKGFRTVVANVDGELYLNETGNPGLASGGTGDVLTGMIAGLLGQKLSCFDAARLGVYLHGLAGDLVAAERGTVGLIASDLLDTIPLAIRRYQQS